ncbi:MAG: HEAT repeat domain-containing protein [bacterium]
MKVMLFAVALSAMLSVDYTQDPSSMVRRWATTPQPAWQDADPADSLYRAARRALTQKEYETAARLFESIASRFPKSEYAPDALYWKGFALYRAGILDDAVDALESQGKRYPNAGTRGDAEALLIRIKGEQAKRGDATAQRDVNSAAQGTAGDKSCRDMEMQVAALDALQQMDNERVVPLLKKVLARRDACSTSLRKNALFILAQKSGSEREKMLLDVAKGDPNPEVRQDAVFHLSQAKSDAAVDALEDLLLHSDERGVRQNALFALAQIGTERARKILRVFALSDAPVPLRDDAIFQLAQTHDDGDAWIKDAYAKVSDQKLRSDIMFHIASRPGPETNKWLTGVIVDPKENIEQRKNALFHLASSKSGGTELTDVYDRVPVQLKKEILFHIAQRHDAASLDKLIAIAKSDPSPELRKDALFHISQSKDPRALKALEEIVTP